MIIVLVETQMAENMGFVARVMANFGLSSLRLVNPLIDAAHPKALSTAVHAKDVLQNAISYTTLHEALADCTFVYGATALERDMVHRYVAPCSLHVSPRTAVVFGRESTGLRNDELSLCHSLIHIPTSSYKSLNLSHAVGIVAYEAFKKTHDPREQHMHYGATHPASHADISSFLKRLENHLDGVDFWRVASKKPTMLRHIQSTFHRMQLTDQELRTLNGMVRALVKRM